MTTLLSEKLYIINLIDNNDFEIEITRSKYEELCMDLWNICIDKVDETIIKAKLKKEEIDEIILVGGSTRTPKIKQMGQDYFNKQPLQNINPDEVVANGTLLAQSLNITINDIISKPIGIIYGNNKFDTIISSGTILSVNNKNSLVFTKEYSIKKNYKSNIQYIKVYEGKIYLGVFTILLNNDDVEKKIKISMNF